jgi:CTP synthase (UTP-ammonia lyase)
MAEPVRIGLVGDYSDEVRAHRAIPRAFQLLVEHEQGPRVALTWLPTTEIDQRTVGRLVDGLAGLWCVPGSPYAHMDGALSAIRHARETGLPFLGTCGGFQHALIEMARNVLGVARADHAESRPDGDTLLINRLSCSLAGVRGALHLAAGSRLAAIYGAEEAVESYQCNYGLNPEHRALIESSPFAIAALDDAGDLRAVELPGHPFFVATLFQPELSAFAGQVHPLVRAFAQAAAAAPAGAA